MERGRKATAINIFKRRKLTQSLAKKRHGFNYIFIPIVILALFVVAGVFAPLLAPHPPTLTNLDIKFQPPFWQAGGSLEYPLGTDALGRDILTRLLFGARVSLTFVVLGIAVSASLGTVLGLIAGYIGGWIDIIIMRTADLAMSIPGILLAMVLAIALGAGLSTLVIVVGLLIWSFFARQVRAETLTLKEQNFVALAKISGCSTPRIIIRHIFPNLVATVIVISTLQVGGIILLEAALSFLGVGIPPPSPSWGTMISDGRGVIDTAWWVAFFPGLAMSIVVLCSNLFGDWLRDKLDPKLRQL